MPIRDMTDPLAQLEPEQIRELFNRAIEDKASGYQESRMKEAALDFVEAHPEFIPGQHNGALIDAVIAYTGTEVRSFQDIEKVYEDLRSRGLMQIDANVIAEQEAESRRARINAARNFRGTRQQQANAQAYEDAAWTMSLEDLEIAVNREAHEQHTRSNDSTPAGFNYEPSSSGRRTRSGI